MASFIRDRADVANAGAAKLRCRAHGVICVTLKGPPLSPITAAYTTDPVNPNTAGAKRRDISVRGDTWKA